MYKEKVRFISDDIKVNVKISKEIISSYHYHSSIELIYILKGSLEVDKIDHKYSLNEGDFYIVNSQDIHSIKTKGKDNVVLMAYIDEELIKDLHGGLYDDMFRARYIKSISDKDYLCNDKYLEEKRAAVQKAKDYLLRIYLINDSYKKEIRSEYLNNYKAIFDYYYEKLIDLIIKDFGITEFFKQIGNLDNEMVKKVYKFIRYASENYNRKITLDEISKELNFNKYYISHLLNISDFGGLNKYLNSLRAYKGRDMLFVTDKSVSEISELVGFSTSGMFIKNFKDNFGVTPIKYRSLLKTSGKENISDELDEKSMNEVIKENIENHLEFYESLKFHESINLNLKSIDKGKYKNMPRINFILKSDNPVYDNCRLKERDTLYSINFSECKIASDIKVENNDIELRYEKLLKSIRENIDLEEIVHITDLISDSEIETNLYYYYSFLNMLKENIVAYNRDYLITVDEEGNFGVLILIKKKVEIKLDLPIVEFRAAIHKLINNKLEKVLPLNDREGEIIRRITKPQCSFYIINDGKLILTGEPGDKYLIEINR